VTLTGLEPATFWLRTRCNCQLCYSAITTFRIRTISPCISPELTSVDFFIPYDVVFLVWFINRLPTTGIFRPRRMGWIYPIDMCFQETLVPPAHLLPYSSSFSLVKSKQEVFLKRSADGTRTRNLRRERAMQLADCATAPNTKLSMTNLGCRWIHHHAQRSDIHPTFLHKAFHLNISNLRQEVSYCCPRGIRANT
jgi:hypothetical protein